MDGGQAQAGAEAGSLGGVEGLEGAGGYLWCHAGSGVGDGEAGVVAGAGAVEAGAGGGEGEGAAVGHGGAGVDAEVEDGLFQLPGVGPDGGQGGPCVDCECGAGTDAGAEQGARTGDDGVEVGALGPGGRAAADDEQLPGQGACPVDGVEDVLRVSADVAGVGAVLDEAGEAGDGAEHVVEVVGDAGGELADGLQPLGAAGLLLVLADLGCGADLGGDVAGDGREAGDLAVVVAHGGYRDGHVDDGAVLAQAPGLEGLDVLAAR